MKPYYQDSAVTLYHDCARSRGMVDCYLWIQKRECVGIERGNAAKASQSSALVLRSDSSNARSTSLNVQGGAQNIMRGKGTL